MMQNGVRQNTVPQAGTPSGHVQLSTESKCLRAPAHCSTAKALQEPPSTSSRRNHSTRLGWIPSSRMVRFGAPRAAIGLNIPLRPNLTVNLNGSYQSGGGYVERTGNQMRSLAGSVTWTPMDRLTIKGGIVYNGRFDPQYYGTPLLNAKVDPNRKTTFNTAPQAFSIHERDT